MTKTPTKPTVTTTTTIDVGAPALDLKNIPTISEEELIESRKSTTFTEFRGLACAERGDYSDKHWRRPSLPRPRKKRDAKQLLSLTNSEVKVEVDKDRMRFICGPWALSFALNSDGQLRPDVDFILGLLITHKIIYPESVFPELTLDQRTFLHSKFIFSPANVEAYVRNMYGAKAYQLYRRFVMSIFSKCMHKIMAELRGRYPQLQCKSITCSEKSERLMAQVPGVQIINHYAVIDFT